MKKQIFIICLVIFYLFPDESFASPVINEFSSSTSDDWIEIYNPDQSLVDLAQYRLRDSTENNKLDLSGGLAPMSFATFEWANKLNNGGDIIKLVQVSDNASIDQVTYGNQGGLIAPDINQSAGRVSDGASNWTIFTTSSKNSSNNSSSVFTPPSPTPSKTPTPTKTPPTPKTTANSPIKSPTPLKSLIITSTSLVSKAKPSSNRENSGKIAQSFEASQFLGIRNLTSAPEKPKETEVLGASDKKFPMVSMLGGLLLILAGVLTIVLKYINIKEIYEKIFNK